MASSAANRLAKLLAQRRELGAVCCVCVGVDGAGLDARKWKTKYGYLREFAHVAGCVSDCNVQLCSAEQSAVLTLVGKLHVVVHGTEERLRHREEVWACGIHVLLSAIPGVDGVDVTVSCTRLCERGEQGQLEVYDAQHFACQYWLQEGARVEDSYTKTADAELRPLTYVELKLDHDRGAKR